MAFGDLVLEDMRDYRIRQLSGTGVEPLFQLRCSAADTSNLARRILAVGLRAMLTCVDHKKLPKLLVGRLPDATFLPGFPAGIDPSGERGEFHTVCFAWPMFASEIAVQVDPFLVTGSAH